MVPSVMCWVCLRGALVRLWEEDQVPMTLPRSTRTTGFQSVLLCQSSHRLLVWMCWVFLPVAVVPLWRSIFVGPMGVAIMGGLIVATALTLLFRPALYAAWFKATPDSWPAERSFGRRETAWALLAPPGITAMLVLAVGMLGSTPFSPLHCARFFTTLEYTP